MKTWEIGRAKYRKFRKKTVEKWVDEAYAAIKRDHQAKIDETLRELANASGINCQPCRMKKGKK